MNNLYDILEICLQEMENPTDVETLLARYPEFADELRPILKAAAAAQKMTAYSEPTPAAVNRGRAKLLQRAAEMREAKVPPRKRIIPLFQRIAISLTLAATFLVSGTGLVGASSSALPGQQLYPVKRSWEDARLFFIFDKNARKALEDQFESERLREVNELLTEGRGETIQFVGVFNSLNGAMDVSGVKVLLPAAISAPTDGAPVTVTGKTNAQGFVEVESIALLPVGAMVPAGQPLKIESNSNANSPIYEMKGTLNSSSGSESVINGETFHLDSSVNTTNLQPGASVEVQGYYAKDGNFIVTDIKQDDSETEHKDNNPSDASDD